MVQITLTNPPGLVVVKVLMQMFSSDEIINLLTNHGEVTDHETALELVLGMAKACEEVDAKELEAMEQALRAVGGFMTMVMQKRGNK